METAYLLVLLKAATVAAAGEVGKQLLAEVRKRLSRQPDAPKILDNYQRKPDVWAEPLRDALEELRISEDPDISSLAEQVAQRAKISQSAIGRTVVQAGGDVDTVIGGDVHIHAPQDNGFSSLRVEVPTEPTHELVYQEYAGYLGNVGGSAPGVGVVVDFGQSPKVFESDEQDHLRTIARQMLGIRGGDERQDDKLAEIDTTQADVDPRVLVHFRAEGVAYIRQILSGQAMLSESLLGESYRITRCLYSESIRRIYGGTSQGQVTIGVTWPPEGISPGGLLAQATPPSAPTGWRGAKHSWTGDFKTDPWPMIQEFAVLALSRAGYKYHEKRIREMDMKTFLELWFPPSQPFRGVITGYPL
jgi:hypothetical protein